MQDFIHSPTGLIHVIVSVLALITGSIILFAPKGTLFHKKVGYIYSASMLLVNISALSIYHLFGSFGIFHIAAVVSLLTLLAGMIPILFKNRFPNWLPLHLSFMYWSVMGLYAAFASEMAVRIPETPFFSMVGIATGVIMITASIIFGRNKKRWETEFRGV